MSQDDKIDSTSNARESAKPISRKATCFVGSTVLIVATILVLFEKINGAHWASALGINAALCVALLALDRLIELRFGKYVRLILAQVEQAKKEIFVKEEQIKELTQAILELFRFEAQGLAGVTTIKVSLGG
jgi:hypothetical protein